MIKKAFAIIGGYCAFLLAIGILATLFDKRENLKNERYFWDPIDYM